MYPKYLLLEKNELLIRFSFVCEYDYYNSLIPCYFHSYLALNRSFSQNVAGWIDLLEGNFILLHLFCIVTSLACSIVWFSFIIYFCLDYILLRSFSIQGGKIAGLIIVSDELSIESFVSISL